jgi:molybdopterin converting factor small subunit
MMKVRVKYYGVIRNPKIVDKLEDEICLFGSGTVEKLLQSLVRKHGDEFRSMLLTPDWEPLLTTSICLNGHDISETDGLNTKLEDNSELSITAVLAAIEGG